MNREMKATLLIAAVLLGGLFLAGCAQLQTGVAAVRGGPRGQDQVHDHSRADLTVARPVRNFELPSASPSPSTVAACYCASRSSARHGGTCPAKACHVLIPGVAEAGGLVSAG